MANPKSVNKHPNRGRFDKLVNHIVQKSSPSSGDAGNPMSNETEEEAYDQEKKKRKLKNVDLSDGAFH
jgi:hypothetical protein